MSIPDEGRGAGEPEPGAAPQGQAAEIPVQAEPEEPPPDADERAWRRPSARVRGPSPRAIGAERPGRRLSPQGTIAASAVVAALAGWLAAEFRHQTHDGVRTPFAGRTQTGDLRETLDGEVAALRFRHAAIDRRLDELAKRLETVAATASEAVAKLPRDADAGSNRDPLSLAARATIVEGRLAAFENAIESLKTDLTALADRTKTPPAAVEVAAPLASAFTPFASEDNRDLAQPVLETWAVDDEALTPGVALFKQGKYREALDVFTKLEQTQPDDARVWYLAALSLGFAKGEWTGEEIDRLVEKGIDREKAGKPRHARIEAALREIPASNGKDWLAACRIRVNIH